jgi:hypothetical protein
MVKKCLIFFLILTTTVFADENTCKYEKKTETVNGIITNITEVKVCNETIQLQEKTFWEKFVSSPQYTDTLIIILATILHK